MPGRAGRNRNRDPFHYWNNTAHTKSEARALAADIGLDMATPEQMMMGPQCGLQYGIPSQAQLFSLKRFAIPHLTLRSYPIRRLIITNTDTPANYVTLLGPLWESGAGDIIKKTRIEVLLCPPPGSPAHMSASFLDAGAPRFAPRGPTAEEEAELKKVRDMQQVMGEQMGDRVGGDVKTNDIKEMLMGMGGDWAKNLGALQAAVNNKNQGVGR